MQINSATSTTAIPANTPTVVPLSDQGKHSSNVTFVQDNSATVPEAGNYLINYSMYPTLTSTAATDLLFAVRSNGVNLDETISEAHVSGAATFPASYIGSAIVHLDAGAVVDSIVRSTTPASMSFDATSISSLILFKLD